MSKKQSKLKYKVAHNSKEVLELLKKAKKGEIILWDEKTPCKVIYEFFTKTNHSQQEIMKIQIRNIREIARNQGIEEGAKKARREMENSKCYLELIQQGKQIREDEIIKIIDDDFELSDWGKDRIKKKIKGDDEK